MDVALLHPSRFLKSQEFQGKDVTYTIKSIVLEELEDENAQKKVKGLMTFEETPKALVINRTNSDCIKGMFGRETNNWIGKRVTLFPEPFFNRMTKEHTTAIRVRGSPDIKEATTVTVALPRKKPVQMKMSKTSGKASTGPLSGDALADELAAIDELISSGESPEALDAIWSAGMGKRIQALPEADRAARVAAFATRKKALRAAPPSTETPF